MKWVQKFLLLIYCQLYLRKKIPCSLEADGKDKKPILGTTKPSNWKTKGDITFRKDGYLFFAQFQGKEAWQMYMWAMNLIV